jgi:sec-independent protein translocase protein TatA
MGSFGPVHWLIVAVVVLLLFGGRGKLSGLMGDAAKGIRAFRDGLKDDAHPAPPAAPQPAPQVLAPVVEREPDTTAH